VALGGGCGAAAAWRRWRGSVGWQGQRLLALGGRREANAQRGRPVSFSFVTKAGGRLVRLGWLMVELSFGNADSVALRKI